MPTKFSDDFEERAATVEKRRANLESTIAYMHKALTGTPEDVVAAFGERAAFLEERGNERAARNIEAKTPDTEKVRNLRTLQDDLGEQYDFVSRIDAILHSIDIDFPELDTDDKLFLKQDILQAFAADKPRSFALDGNDFDNTIEYHFPNMPKRDVPSGTFAKSHCGQHFHAVVAVDPGAHTARNEMGEVSENAAAVKFALTQLDQDIRFAAGEWEDIRAQRSIRTAAAPQA